MDEDLLDDYFAGRCTPEEAARVRHWLDQPLSDENRLSEQSWHQIRKHIRDGATRPLNPWSPYFIAASVVLLMVCAIGWKLVQQEFVIRNSSPRYKTFAARGLQFRLPPQAAARINLGVGSQRTDLLFCGPVRIQNNSESDVDMRLNLNCVSADHPNFTTLLKARKDKKYVAFQYHFKSDELVVVEEDRIFDLPLPLQQKALKALKI